MPVLEPDVHPMKINEELIGIKSSRSLGQAVARRLEWWGLLHTVVDEMTKTR